MAGFTDVIKAAGVKEADAKKVIDAIATIAATENVTIRGFGTFKTTTRAARKGRNPQTGAEIEIAAKTGLTFKASK